MRKASACHQDADFGATCASIQRQVRATLNYENKKPKHMLPLASLMLTV